jgi:hypothetical protein
MDTVRGLNSGHAGVLYTNATNSEDTGATSSIRAFNSDGFNLGTDGGVNFSGSTYVGWAWDAGSSTVSNTDGNITSSVRASAASGFSIVTWTGNGSSSASVGHGLNAPLDFIITKGRSGANEWNIKHSSLPSNHNLQFVTAGSSDASNYNSGGIANLTSSSTFGFVSGNSGVNNVNANGTTYVAYCLTAIAGFSAFGSYTGNGSSDGPFIHTGFKVAFLLYKRTNSSQPWYIVDAARDPDNVALALLSPNDSAAEDTGSGGVVDLLSNGFKPRASFQTVNASGGEYIYWAVAENPFQANGGLAR